MIITAASDSGMVDIHDRWPLVLTAEHAREWIEPGLSAMRAEEMANECCSPVDDFEWFAVDKRVENVNSQGANLIIPVTTPPSGAAPRL